MMMQLNELHHFILRSRERYDEEGGVDSKTIFA